MSTKVLWVFYIAGAASTLLIKYLSYCYHGHRMGKSFLANTREWFLEATVANAVSWTTSLTNIAIAWTIGRIYINKLAIWDVLGSLPLDNSLSFLLGILAEVAAPNAMKWVLAKFPGGAQ